jgi:hypothetical protein
VIVSADTCHKLFAIFDKRSNRRLLWYNVHRGNVEQIGLATHPGCDLGFPEPQDEIVSSGGMTVL